jgi:hypothetical protein
MATNRQRKSAGASIRGACAFLEINKLTLCALLPTLCPSLLHCVGDALPAFGTQFASARCCCRRRGSSSILAAFGPASARACCGRSRPSQQSARLLQLQYLSINLSNNTIYFHVLPPVGIELALSWHNRFNRSAPHRHGSNSYSHIYDDTERSNIKQIVLTRSYFDLLEAAAVSSFFASERGA